MNFKIGDKVKCVDNDSSKELELGKIYTVTWVDLAGVKIQLDSEYPHYRYYTSRFEKVKESDLTQISTGKITGSEVPKITTIIDSENIRPFDVDGTLITYDGAAEDEIEIVDDVEEDAVPITAYVNRPMVRLVKEEAKRGSCVIVWSRGGYRWARAVVSALKLEAYVNIIMSKPTVYFDDQPAETWLVDRVYMAPTTKYKR